MHKQLIVHIHYQLNYGIKVYANVNIGTPYEPKGSGSPVVQEKQLKYTLKVWWNFALGMEPTRWACILGLLFLQPQAAHDPGTFQRALKMHTHVKWNVYMYTASCNRVTFQSVICASTSYLHGAHLSSWIL